MIEFKKILFCIFIFFLCTVNQITAQEFQTIIVGQVVNSIDKTPVAEVHVFFKNLPNGVKTDDEGYFMIRTNEPAATVLIFSCIGYDKKEIKVKPGQSVGMLVQLNEQNTMLQDVIVIPGANPALSLLKKVRNLKSVNDISFYPELTLKRNEQGVVFLSKVNQRSVNKRIFTSLSESSVSAADSSLINPVYISENNYLISGKVKKEIDVNTEKAPDKTEILAKNLLGELKTNVNFYENSIFILDKNLVSPLSSSGNLFYNYFLTDSTRLEGDKIYRINYYSKNQKNLTFNGTMQIDSATCALVSIKAKLSSQANINYIKNLSVVQNFRKHENTMWIPADERITMNLTYELFADSLNPKPELFISNSAVCVANGNLPERNLNFAGTEYSRSEIDEKLALLNDTRLLRTAKWIADVAITGYIPVWKFDIGKIQEIMRITETEGVKFYLPLRTNEKMMKNFCVGGDVGYGFGNHLPNYSAYVQIKLNKKLNTVLETSFTNDFRRTDYNYNNFMQRENPLITGDADIANTVFGFRAGTRMNQRKEFSAGLSTDINKDIETKLIFRSNELLSSEWLPLTLNGTGISSLKYQTLVATARFSFGERTYEDHFQRVHIRNYAPLIYPMLQVGRYQAGSNSGNFAKLSGTLKQDVNFDLGKWIYIIQAGCTFGNVPYPLLDIPMGSENYGYGYDKFSLMYTMEFAVDKYVLMHNDLVFNGILFNQIPGINLLKLREMVSFKILYGGLNNAHQQVLDFPGYMKPLNKPYMEAGIGVANILGVLNLQSIWRISGDNGPATQRWGILSSFRLSF